MGIQIEQNDGSEGTTYTMQFRFDQNEADGIEFSITGSTIMMRPVGSADDMNFSIIGKGSGTVTGNGLVIENRTSDPSSPVEGQIWNRTDL